MNKCEVVNETRQDESEQEQEGEGSWVSPLLPCGTEPLELPGADLGVKARAGGLWGLCEGEELPRSCC